MIEVDPTGEGRVLATFDGRVLEVLAAQHPLNNRSQLLSDGSRGVCVLRTTNLALLRRSPCLLPRACSHRMLIRQWSLFGTA